MKKNRIVLKCSSVFTCLLEQLSVLSLFKRRNVSDRWKLYYCSNNSKHEKQTKNWNKCYHLRGINKLFLFRYFWNIAVENLYFTPSCFLSIIYQCWIKPRSYVFNIALFWKTNPHLSSKSIRIFSKSSSTKYSLTLILALYRSKNILSIISKLQTWTIITPLS